MSVSEALDAHAAGRLPRGRAAVSGWWTNGSIGHSCAAPIANPGELELYCHDGEFGITERDEPIFVVDLSSSVVTYQARGPHLTPFLSEDIAGIQQLFALPYVNGQPYPPVPITVIGHFDDPRAAQCQPDKLQLCLDRLVLEQIVSFEPDAVATPGVTPSPTPFPSPGPSGLFAADRCAGDVPYAFVGWTTTADLQLQFDRPGHVYAMVTRDVVVLTEDGWADDPNGSGHTFQIWGRRICIAEESSGFDGAVEYGSVPDTTYVLWDDGLKVPGDNPLRP
jgi:hypothetical protein